MGLLYSRKYFNKSSKKAALDLVDNLRETFIDILHTVSWMDDATRAKAIEKAKAMAVKIGYPDELNVSKSLDEYYSGLEMNPNDFFSNVLKLQVFNVNNSFGSLRDTFNKTGWGTLLELDSTDVNAFYDTNENSISKTSSKCSNTYLRLIKSHNANKNQLNF